jgi:hypothetical protein
MIHIETISPYVSPMDALLVPAEDGKGFSIDVVPGTVAARAIHEAASTARDHVGLTSDAAKYLNENAQRLYAEELAAQREHRPPTPVRFFADEAALLVGGLERLATPEITVDTDPRLDQQSSVQNSLVLESAERAVAVHHIIEAQRTHLGLPPTPPLSIN